MKPLLSWYFLCDTPTISPVLSSGVLHDMTSTYSERVIFIALQIQLKKLAEERQENCFTAEVLAKPEHHRFLIGRGGINIHKVREKTGVRIVFPTRQDENKELITIIGKQDAVEKAKEELLAKIKDLVFMFLCLFCS